MISGAPRDVANRKASSEEEELRHLMVRYQNADPLAVEELVRRLSPALHRFLAGPDLAQNDAEDLLQDCWIRIHRSRHTYRASEPLLPWIYAIARHSRVDGYRRRTRLRKHEVLLADVPESHAESGSSLAPKPADIGKLVNSLPPAQREVLMMLKVSGMTLSEVALATASTAGAVKQKAHRAYKKLRQLMAEKPDGR